MYENCGKVPRFFWSLTLSASDRMDRIEIQVGVGFVTRGGEAGGKGG